MSGLNIPLIGAGGLQEPALGGTPKKAEHAAVQFESLLLTQLLRAAHTEDSGWLGSGSEEDPASGQATALAEEFLAQAMASNGGLGIARMISQDLKGK